MKLIIDMPEEMYNNVKKDLSCDSATLKNAVKNGIPIPDSVDMGDFISRDAVYEEVRNTIAEYMPYFNSITSAIPLEVAKAILRIPAAKVE